METCVASYTSPHQSSNEAPPSPTNSNSSNLDNDTMLTSSTTTPILTSPTTPTPTSTTDKNVITRETNRTVTTIENEIIQMNTPPATPTSPRRINQLHRRLSRYPSTTLSDLIPAATAALKASQQLKKETERSITEEGQDQYQQQEGTSEQVLGSTFARALAKVRVQVQTKRLKEKYLTLEWVRLALALPVDESIINNSKHPLPPMKKKYVDPEQLLQEQQQRTRITREERDDDGNTIRMIALKTLKGRTGEIATWYEWKIDKSKFTMEQVESKVDRLRTRIQEKKQTISTFIT
ncbi:hypothetical protein INT45_006078 [Circinella minor]|uniref:Uncharacterized protein n=1 Tax=Circinella minor TaxID=1195481 RepID=A0A8H7RYS0_9FUNG|nr:hypothetical protein INT45_006078 [Circinella minor]